MKSITRKFIHVFILCCFTTCIVAGNFPWETRCKLIENRLPLDMPKIDKDNNMAVAGLKLASVNLPEWWMPQNKPGKAREKSGYNGIKDEQELTISEIIDVFLSFTKWSQSGKCVRYDIYSYSKKDGENAVKVLSKWLYYRIPDMYFKKLTIKGPVIKYSMIMDVCDPANPGKCPSIVKSEIEIVSKTDVRIKQTIITHANNLQKRKTVERFYCEFIKN